MAKKGNLDAATSEVAAPTTIEEALEVIAKLEQTIADQEEVIENLKGDFDEALNKALAELNAEILALKDQLAEPAADNSQDEVISELNAKITELEKKIEEYKTGVVIMPEVTIGGKKYQVNNGTLHEGVRYSREELAKNESVCESILAINGQLTITPLNVEEAN